MYRTLGFEDRYDYFERLSKRFNVPIMKIILKAEELGKEQDFSGLLDWLDKEQNNAIRQKNHRE